MGSSAETNASLHPQLVRGKDTGEWVQIVDESGNFAGFDPSSKQIWQALFGDRTELTQDEYIRFKKVQLATDFVHDDIASEGLRELTGRYGDDLAQSPDIVAASEAYADGRDNDETPLTVRTVYGRGE